MANPTWKRTLEEVLKHKTQATIMSSEKTGNKYTVDVIPVLQVVSTGSVANVDGKFKYSIVDTKNNLEYTIKTTNAVDVKFGTILHFRNVRSGTTSGEHGWYAADSVTVVEK